MPSHFWKPLRRRYKPMIDNILSIDSVYTVNIYRKKATNLIAYLTAAEQFDPHNSEAIAAHQRKFRRGRIFLEGITKIEKQR